MKYLTEEMKIEMRSAHMSAHRMHLSPHEWAWTQKECEEMSNYILWLNRTLETSNFITRKLIIAIDMAILQRGLLPVLARKQCENVIDPLVSTFEEFGITVGESLIPKEYR